jgi:hypothetical protein
MLELLLLLFVFAWAVWILKTYKAKNFRRFWILCFIPIALIVVVSIAIGVLIKNYPLPWQSLILNQRRTEIHQKLGTPDVGEFWDVKSDMWVSNHFLSWHRLDVIYNQDTIARDYIIKFYFGTKKYFRSYDVESSFDK